MFHVKIEILNSMINTNLVIKYCTKIKISCKSSVHLKINFETEFRHKIFKIRYLRLKKITFSSSDLKAFLWLKKSQNISC